MSRSRPSRILPSRIGHGRRFILIASQFNRPVALALVRGATAVLRRSGTSAASIRLLWVPGAFELPVMAARAARMRPRPDAIIALGAVIRGGTTQYHVIAQAAANGLAQVAVDTGVPVTLGVIVAESAAQARARSGGREGNRGAEAALAALALLRTFKSIA